MKKIFLFAGMIAVISLASCNGSGKQSGNDTTSALSIDSMVNEATSSVGATADSAASAIDSTAQAVSDSIKKTVDSAAH